MHVTSSLLDVTRTVLEAKMNLFGSEVRGGVGGLTYVNLVKDTAIPLQAWTGPWGSRRLRLPDFKTVGT
jgi:hypothetical protein